MSHSTTAASDCFDDADLDADLLALAEAEAEATNTNFVVTMEERNVAASTALADTDYPEEDGPMTANFLAPATTEEHIVLANPDFPEEEGEHLTPQDAADLAERLSLAAEGEDELTMAIAMTEERFEPPEHVEYPFADDSSQMEQAVVGEDWIPGTPLSEGVAGEEEMGEIEAREEGEVVDMPSPLTDADTAVKRRPTEYSIPEPQKRRKTSNEDGTLVPFVRGPFPQEVQPRGVVDGLSARTVIKTCFRIGEALQVAIAALAGARDGDVLIELYARVAFSERVDTKQNFQFLDLFHDRPPFLSGVFEFWRRCELWDVDSSRFLGEEGKGRIARVVGRMKRREGRVGSGTTVWVQILLVGEVGWECVRAARRVVCL